MKWTGKFCMCVLGIACLMISATVVSAVDVVPVAPVGLADSPWPDYGGGAQNKHLANARAFTGSPEIRWAFDLSAVEDGRPQLAFHQPALGPDGSITFATSPLGAEHIRSDQIHSLWPDGSVKWAHATPQGVARNIQNWIAIDDGGNVAYATWLRNITDNGTVIMRDPDDGNVVWTYGSPLPRPPIRLHTAQTGSVIVDHNGQNRIVAVDDAGVVTALNSLGQLQWQLDLPNTYYVNPAITSDKLMIFGGDQITAVTFDGAIAWAFDQPSNRRFLSPSVADNGTIYVSNNPLDSTRKVIALSPTGSLLWQKQGVGGPISIGPDGTLYAADRDRVVAIDPDTAAELWSYHTGGIMDSNAEGVTVDLNGNIFIGTERGELLSLSPFGELRWSIDLDPDSAQYVGLSAPVIGANGDIYVAGGYTGKFFALSAVRIPEPASVVFIGMAFVAFYCVSSRCCGRLTSPRWRDNA